MVSLEVGAPPSPSPIFGGFAEIVASLEPTPAPVVNATLRLYQHAASSSSSYLLPALIGATVFFGVLGGVMYRRTYGQKHAYQAIPQTELEKA